MGIRLQNENAADSGNTGVLGIGGGKKGFLGIADGEKGVLGIGNGPTPDPNALTFHTAAMTPQPTQASAPAGMAPPSAPTAFPPDENRQVSDLLVKMLSKQQGA